MERVTCPNCRAKGGDNSGDNLVVYDDGTTWCFSCNMGDTKKDKVVQLTEKKPTRMIDGTCRDLEARGINKKTCELYDYRVGKYTGRLGNEYVSDETVQIANYKSILGQTCAQKLRSRDKKFCITGSPKEMGLFGRHLYTPSRDVSLTITEGEIDALSVSQVFSNKYPVVSIPNGASSARRTLQNDLEWVSSFKSVVLLFDNDDDGQQAIQACLDLFEPGYVRVGTITGAKDANDLLVQGRDDDLRKAIWNAQTIRPDSIVSVADIMEDALTRPERGVSWPWETMSNLTYGIQLGQIYTFGAGSGIGKTEVFKDIALHLAFHHKEPVGIISFEQKPATTLLRLVGGMLGKRLHVPGDDWDEKEIKETMESLQDKVYFYDHFGSQELDTTINKIRFFVSGLGIKYIFLDHLTALAADMQDERKGIDKAMSRLGSLVQELDCTLFLVSHLAKPPAEELSYEEGRRVTPTAFRGSQSIQYWSSFMVGLERDKLNEDPDKRKITTVRILKDRFSGEADGETFTLKYNASKGSLEEAKRLEDDVL